MRRLASVLACAIGALFVPTSSQAWMLPPTQSSIDAGTTAIELARRGGGLGAAALVAAVGASWFDLPRVAFLSLCLGVVLISVVGDLTESMFKRHAGLKDSGSVFPGHGGVLDRIDSVTAAAPVFLLGLRWLGSPP